MGGRVWQSGHCYIIFTFSPVGGGWNLTGTLAGIGAENWYVMGFYNFFDFFLLKNRIYSKIIAQKCNKN